MIGESLNDLGEADGLGEAVGLKRTGVEAI